MATYVVGVSSWNDTLFWQGIDESTPGHTLDFSGLGAAYAIDIDQATGIITISDGLASFTVGEAGVVGTDANLGGATLLEFFTSISGAQGADDIQGTSGADVLDGNAGDDTIFFGEGADTVHGGDGNDLIDDMGGFDATSTGNLLHGDGGNDTISASAGNDTIYGGTGDDSIHGESGDDQVFGGAGADTIEGHAGSDFVIGGAGADLIFGGDGADSLEGGWEDAAADTIHGGTGNDLIFGYGGDDLIFGNEDADWIDGGAGNDSIEGGIGQDRIVGDLGSDTILGGAGNDTLTGGEGADSIDGGDDADQIWGNAGDTIVGGEGGDDNDTLYVSFVDFITYTTAESGTITFNAGDTLQFSGIEQVIELSPDGVVDGTSGDDQIGQFYIDADGEVIDNGDAIGEGDGDSVRAGDGNDSIWSNDGDDTVHGEGGNDSIYLGSGNNVAFGGAGADTIDAEWGNDTISGDDFTATGPNLIVNGSFEDTTGMTATGYGFNDAGGTVNGWTDANGNPIDFHNDGRGGLTATDGANWMDMEAGAGQHNAISQTVAGVSDGQVYVLSFDVGDQANINDGTTGDNQIQLIWNGDVVGTIDAVDGGWRSYEFNLIGGSGDGSNTLTFAGLGNADANGVSLDNVQMYEGLEAAGGADSIIGWDGDDDLMGGAGNDTIDAGLGADMVVAGSGNDSVLGGAGNDTIWGGAGGDTIDGGAGADTLFGGDGNDLFISSEGADSVDGGTTWYDIVDYGNSGAAVTIDLSDTLVESGGHAEGDTLLNIEQVSGSAFDDVFVASDTGMDFAGQEGDDTFTGGAGNDRFWGGAGQDVMYTSGGADLLEGQEDADTFIVSDGFGATTITGGEAFTTGTDFDVIDLSAVTTGVTVDWSAPEAGTIISGADTITFSEIEKIILTDQADLLNAVSETVGINVDGAGGDDTLNAGSGNDTLIGGSGQNYLDGGAGDDSLVGNATDIGSFTQMTGGAGADTLDGTAGDWDIANYFASSAGVQVDLTDGLAETGGDAQGDVLIGIEQVDGSNVAGDTIIADDGGLQIKGWGGNDNLVGGAGADILEGGAGNDSLVGGNGDDLLVGEDGNDTLVAGNNTGLGDTLLGGAGDDELTDSFWNATLDGGDGADLFNAGYGSAEIYGGEGGTDADTLSFALADDAVDVTFAGDESGSYLDSDGDDGIFTGIEAVVLTTNSDILNASADSTGVDVFAGAGDDSLVGGSGADSLEGGAGNDTLIAGLGSDTLLGGDGNDLLIRSGTDTDNLLNVLSGGAGDDTIRLQDGLNVFDQIDGGDGIDLLEILPADDRNLTVDMVFGTVADGSTGGQEFASIENITTGGGNDAILGDDAANVLDAGAGNDTLTGGAGDDSLYGRAGDDSFVLSDGFGNDVIVGGETGETIGDTLDLSSVTTATTIDLTNANPEQGTVSDGISTATFSEIETVLLGSGSDTVVLADGSGSDVVTGFDLTDSGDGTTVDQLDVSAMTDADGAPVDAWDVVVTDTNGDGTGDAILTFSNGESITLVGVTSDQVDTAGELNSIGIPCFTPGTLIATETGERPVEEIRPGDLVLTADNGLRPVRWAGSRTLTQTDFAKHPNLRPVVIRKNAFGNRRTIRVSPQHGMMLARNGAEYLVRAKHVAEAFGGAVARFDRRCERVTHVHIMFDEHQLVYAEGALSEAFYPGRVALGSLNRSALAELLAIFPELAHVAFEGRRPVNGYGPPARRYLRRKEMPLRLAS